MSTLRTWCRSAFLVLALIFVAAPAFAGDAALNDSARFLAGMEAAPAVP